MRLDCSVRFVSNRKHSFYSNRKYLLEYFGSNASHIKPRPNCCDNCDSGSSNITLSDTYEGIDNDGNYDFTENAYLLLKAMQITSKCAVAVLVLRGSCEKQAMDYRHETAIYGAGRIWPKEYWTLLVNQLKSHDYITTKKLPLPYRPIQIISNKGIEWLKRAPAQRLILKAKPEIYQYLKKKQKVPLKIPLKVGAPSTVTRKEAADSANPKVACSSTSPSETAQENDIELEMEMSDKHLESILFGIRAVLAENSDVGQHLVATEKAIYEMVEKKPMSIKEFKSYGIDGFSLAKIDKFASVFIEGILKFMVR